MMAVHDRDLEALLKGLGIESKLRAGRMLCAQCSRPVTYDTIGALFYESGTVRVLCSGSDCLDSFRGR